MQGRAQALPLLVEVPRARAVDASPAALRALRDLSLVADRLADMQGLVGRGAGLGCVQRTRLAGVVVGLAWGWHEAGTKGWFDVFIKCQLGVIYIMSVRGYL